MQFDTTTFVLEILNFLVLLWLLKRFFYKPVQAAIAARQRKVQEVLDAARAEKADAEKLREQYQQYLQAWEQERVTKLLALEQSLQDERNRQLGKIQLAAADEKARLDACCEQEKQTLQHELQTQARQEALEFLSQLMRRLSSPTLDAHIAQLLVEDLKSLDADRRDALKNATREANGQIEVQSATPLSDTILDALRAQLQSVMDMPIDIKLTTSPELLGGIRLGVGSLRLHLNLQDELMYFRDHIVNGSF